MPNGLDDISRRFERRTRPPLPPQPRRVAGRPTTQNTESVRPAFEPRPTTTTEPTANLPAVPDDSPAHPEAVSIPPVAGRLKLDARPPLSPLDPTVNFGLRIPRPLDDRLADLLHELRSFHVRSSKVEIVEMLLWELPSSAAPDFRERLARFHVAAGANR